MKFLRISPDATLAQISAVVGSRNVESVLASNQLSRTPKIGKALSSLCQSIESSTPEVSTQRKAALLNTFVQDSDVFENAALASNSTWKVISKVGTFPGMLHIPEPIALPDSSNTVGNGVNVSHTVYEQTMSSLMKTGIVDPAVFNTYSNVRPSQLIPSVNRNTNVFQWFHIPWGSITLYSSISGDTVDFPVYPEELSDSIKANYTTMPDMLYQYEPWQIFQGSGPRSNTYTFDFHRDMWTGDHRDGKANELIRFCEANCYPEYNGSSVNVSTVTLYVAGKPLISGILTDASPTWDGPIGLDGWYLHCKLSLTITEVSKQPLNYASVRNKPLIG